MNIAEAKLIPLEAITEHLGGRYSHTDRKGCLWYHSPFRPEERTASFKIEPKNNTWHDFGLSGTIGHHKQRNGGDGIDLWNEYHFKDRRAGVNEALKALRQFQGGSEIEAYKEKRERAAIQKLQSNEPRYKILKIADRITHSGLKEELQRRRISTTLANLYLKQGYIVDTVTQQKYSGFLFENDKGGFEVSIPNPKQQQCFKNCIGPKASTRFIVADEKNSADVFEGFWDYLSWLEFKGIQRPINHTYVLNSISMVSEVCDKIIAFKETVKYAFLFMDNDEAGYQATHDIALALEEDDIQVGSLEQFYKGSKDLSEFWAKGLDSICTPK